MTEEVKTKLDARTKWSYTIGATGRDMAYTLIAMFLMTYIQYTVKLTVAQYAVISAIMVVCLIWDAINDPMMGIIIENSHMKLGKYRPWILLGCLLNAIVIICLFTLRPTGWGFVAFFGVSYLLWGMTYTMNDISYWGMLPSLSSNAKERNTLVTLMSIFICVGQFTVAGVVPVIVAGNAVNSYRFAALGVALCFVVFQLLTFFGVKERHHEAEDNVETLGLKDMFKIFFRNDQLVFAGISTLLYNIGSGLLFLFSMNFFYFEFGYSTGGSLIFMFTVTYGAATLISQCVFPLLTKYFSRQKLLGITTGIIIAGYLALLGTGYVIPMNAIIVYVLGFIIFFNQGLFNLTVIIMLNNTIEYDEWKFHERHDSIISAVRSFAVKLASAINQGLVTLVLIISGIYSISQKVSSLEVSKETGELTSEQVLQMADSFIQTATKNQLFVLRLGMTLIPIVAITVAMLILTRKYIITEEKYNNIVSDLQK